MLILMNTLHVVYEFGESRNVFPFIAANVTLILLIRLVINQKLFQSLNCLGKNSWKITNFNHICFNSENIEYVGK